jgi:pyruvate,water dikinase
MMIASAIVIDIGGPMSHGAIVARELGIPCVINTKTGTRVLKSGERVRVDGGAGTVERLGR